MTRYFIEPRTRKYVKGYGFLSSISQIEKKIFDTATKIRLDAAKVVFKSIR